MPALTGSGPADCCSGNALFDAEHGIWACLPGKATCLSDFDCEHGTVGRGKGFLCPELFAETHVGCPT